MEAATSISLRFAEGTSAVVRARLSYALRVFAAVYGYRVEDKESVASSFRLTYGEPSVFTDSVTDCHVPSRYRARPLCERPPSPVKHVYADETVFLFYGVDPATGNPDWLGEIFEWVSCDLELNIKARDSIGRIPLSEGIFAREKITARRPHAMPVMAWLENYLRQGGNHQALARPTSPLKGWEHIVVCSHDLDFYFTGRGRTLKRLGKNLGVGVLLYRDWTFTMWNAWRLVRAALGERVGDYLPDLLDEAHRREFTSTLFAVARHGHRRDPDYTLAQLCGRLISARQAGFEVALHGSYGSVVERRDLAAEASLLAGAAGRVPLGNRQHWLRFDAYEHLFECVEGARLAYDSSLGFDETAGFRNGAAFAFPPYDFKKERPHEFLEIPLALMDGSIEADTRKSHEKARDIVREVLEESRRWGWGGISLLWHNPIEPLHVPEEINRIFWECAEARGYFAEKWMSAEEFLRLCLPRYQNAGLLRGVHLDA